MQETARRCHVAGSHLSRLFQAFHGIGSLRYVRERQMECAAQRLHASHGAFRVCLELPAGQIKR